MSEHPRIPEIPRPDGPRQPDAEPGYAVGYGKPPRHTQFCKGQSGNPKGRPKGSFNVETTLRRELLAPITVKDAGKRKRMTKFQLACRQQINKAAAGDIGSFKLIMQLAQDCLNDADFRRPIQFVPSPRDAALL